MLDNLFKFAKIKPFGERAQTALQFTRELHAAGKSFTEVSNLLFGSTGKLLKLFPTAEDRLRFNQTEEHREITALLAALSAPPPVEPEFEPEDFSTQKARRGRSSSNGHGLTLDMLLQAKELAKELGGIDRARAALDALAKLTVG